MDHKFKFPVIASPDLVTLKAEDVQAAIDALNEADLRKSTIEELKALLVPLFQGYVITTPILAPGVRVYRIRRFPNEKPEIISALGAPPRSNVQRDQRCNRCGESMFYCSSARQAPFFEMHARIGDILVLSEWKTIRKILVNNVGYTPSVFGSLKSNRESPVWGKDAENNWKTTKANSMVHEFLAAKFTQDVSTGDEYLYKLTIAVTEKMIQGGPFDGLLYPTIAMSGNADNLTLRADCASSALNFVKAEYLQITKVEGMDIAFNVLDTATVLGPDGAIIWKGHPDKWTLKGIGATLRFSPEDGRWIARNTSGNIVDPD
jgi:hypothetical protein